MPRGWSIELDPGTRARSQSLEPGRLRASIGQEAQRIGNAARAASGPATGLRWLDSFVSAGNEMALGGLQGIEGAGASITDPLIDLLFGKEVFQNERKARQARWEAARRAFVSQPNPAARSIGQTAALAAPLPKTSLLGSAAVTAIRGANALQSVYDDMQRRRGMAPPR